MGHVVNYAYRLYERPEWVQAFGAITQPYVEEYRPQPFSRRFVRHLPGWYAQKHPDEDWAETFAVWMTPGLDWRVEYADRPTALASSSCCDALASDGCAPRRRSSRPTSPRGRCGDARLLAGRLLPWLRTRARPVRRPGSTARYARCSRRARAPPSRWRTRRCCCAGSSRCCAPRSIAGPATSPSARVRCVRQLAQRAATLELRYAAGDESRVTVAVTALVTALAMNYVHHGSYLP